MATTQIDQARSGPDTRVYVRGGGRWWAAALGGLLVGALAATAVSGSAATPPQPVEQLIRFDLAGVGSVDYAMIREFGVPGRVAPQVREWHGWTDPNSRGPVIPAGEPIAATTPYVAVLTVRAAPGQQATCRIYIGDSLASEAVATDAASATCVAAAR